MQQAAGGGGGGGKTVCVDGCVVGGHVLDICIMFILCVALPLEVRMWMARLVFLGDFPLSVYFYMLWMSRHIHIHTHTHTRPQ